MTVSEQPNGEAERWVFRQNYRDPVISPWLRTGSGAKSARHRDPQARRPLVESHLQMIDQHIADLGIDREALLECLAQATREDPQPPPG
ncbi:hypothetical protein GCM10009551_048030 [Nocardiopsis tropica]